MKTFFKVCFVISLFVLYIFIHSFTYANSIFQNLSSNIFRLHIIANSDSFEDQNLKLKIRDHILQYLEPFTSSCKSKEEVVQVISNQLLSLQKIALQTTRENGYSYNVTLEVGNFYFPTKYYGNISMPSGNYDALRIKIGEATGQNWWCSLFPALCFTNVSNGVINSSTKNLLDETLSKEEVNLLTNSSHSVQLKFKLVEIFH